MELNFFKCKCQHQLLQEELGFRSLRGKLYSLIPMAWNSHMLRQTDKYNVQG